MSEKKKLPPNMTPAQWRTLCEIAEGKPPDPDMEHKPTLALWYSKLITPLVLTERGRAIYEQYKDTDVKD